MRPAVFALLSPGHKLPPAFGQETMIGSGHKRRAVFERDSVRRFDHAPVREDARLHIAPVPSLTRSSIQHITRTHIRNPSRTAVSHEKRRVAMDAINAAMFAAPVR